MDGISAQYINSSLVSQSVHPSMEKAATKFEQHFIKNMLDASTNSTNGDAFFGNSEQRKLMQDMQNHAISEQLATSKSFGIADLLIQQAKLNNN